MERSYMKFRQWVRCGLTWALLVNLGGPLLAANLWENVDVGNVGIAGGLNSGGDRFELRGSGADVWHSEDAFNFTHSVVSGDFDFSARVVSADHVHEWTKVGIMVRADLGASAPHGFVALSPKRGVVFLRRGVEGGLTEDDAHHSMRIVSLPRGRVSFQQRGSDALNDDRDSEVQASMPHWVRLVRRGEVLRAYNSNNGVDWDWLGTVQIELPEEAYVGLAVNSHDNRKLCHAVIDNVSIGEPEAWDGKLALAGRGDGLMGQYFDHPGHRGSPVERVDAFLNFDLGEGSPITGVSADSFSVRWEGEVEAQHSEPYMVHVVSDDRAKVWLNDSLLIDESQSHPERESTALVNLEAGRRYYLRIDYFEKTGNSVIRLLWSSPSTPKQVIPTSQLFSRVADRDGDGIADRWEDASGLDSNDINDGTRLSVDGLLDNLERFKRGDDLINPIRPLGESGWISADIGRVGRAGSASWRSEDLLVQASGARIGGHADSFHFVHTFKRGDFDLVAKIAGRIQGSRLAQSGLNVRESLDEDSVSLGLTLSGEHGVRLSRRLVVGGDTSHSGRDELDASGWLRMVRRGNAFSSFYSADGQAWRWIGTEALPTTGGVYVGLAGCAHDNSASFDFRFQRISLSEANDVLSVPSSVGRGTGLLGSYIDMQGGAESTRIDPQIDFSWGRGAPIEGVPSDNFFVRWEGYVEAPLTDTFAIHVTSDDGARLWIDDVLVLDDWELSMAAERSVDVSFVGGEFYKLRLEYFENKVDASISLAWSSSAIPRAVIPAERLYLPFGGSSNASLSTSPGGGDAIVSRLFSQREGQALATEAGSASSDSANFELKFEKVATLVGGDIVDSLGKWEAVEGGVRSVDKRGAISFEFNAVDSGIYHVTAELARYREHWDTSYPVSFLLDGIEIQSNDLILPDGRGQTVRSDTQWLLPGRHVITLEWKNWRIGKSLLVRGVEIHRVISIDADGDGVGDWEANQLRRRNIVNAGSVQSYVSPACLEGVAQYPSLARVETGEIGVRMERAGGKQWYSNLALDADVAAEVSISYENGGWLQKLEIDWLTTYLDETDDVSIRLGDSLLFGYSATVSDEYFELKVRAPDGSIDRLAGEEIPFAFNIVGGYEVEGIKTDSTGVLQSVVARVHVLTAELGGTIAAWHGQDRLWQPVSVDKGVLIESGRDIRIEVESSDPGGDTFRLRSMGEGTDFVVARIAASGAVVSSVQITTFNLYSGADVFQIVREVYENGGKRVEVGLVWDPIVEDVEFDLSVLVGGVVLDDGSLHRKLGAILFNELGEASFSYLKSPASITSGCHTIKAFQGGVLLGEK